MSALTNSAIDLTAGREAALIFQTVYNAVDFGWDQNNNNTDGIATVKVTRNVGNIDILEISNDTNIPDEIYEHYFLAPFGLCYRT